MKIVVHDYAGHPFQIQLSRCLAVRGHEVHHIYADGLLTPCGAVEEDSRGDGTFTLHPLPISRQYRKNKYNFVKRRSYEVQYGHRLVDKVLDLAPDVVISGNTPTEPQWNLVRSLGKAGVPVITWVQDFYSLAVAKLLRKRLPLVGGVLGLWYQYLDRKCFQGSCGIVAITEDFVPFLDKFGVPPNRIVTVPNWAPLEELPMVVRDNDWARSQDLVGRFVFLYSGTLAMKHNPALLVALAERFRHDSRVKVVVISEGPGADYLEEMKDRQNLRNLVLLPFQPFNQLPEVLASANVLVSVLEADAGVFSVPSKVLTYLCAGRPVLGAMPTENLASRIICEAGAGYVVAPEDQEGFTAVAADLLENPSKERSMGRRARAYAEVTFNIESVTDQFEAAFRRFMK